MAAGDQGATKNDRERSKGIPARGKRQEEEPRTFKISPWNEWDLVLEVSSEMYRG
jgi:hypothetical protein